MLSILILQNIENELKKRLVYPYTWGKKQNNGDDRLTNFIYDINSFEKLLSEIDIRFKNKPNYNYLFNYALNRWYNYWSARAVESIFCSLPNVIPAKDEKDRLVDFSIRGINFDHKTSVFPRKYPRNYDYAKQHSKDLCEWLYKNQSQEGRKHLKNRLFIVLFSKDGKHWKLKSEISVLKEKIEFYVNNFNNRKLIEIKFTDESIALTDIIWVENYI
ncbi:MAG: hypothetical protein JXA68_09490 [Ignavibacteriales bacterium]|nr:hypothetical protein [Ignavibacteriales bacterium]